MNFQREIKKNTAQKRRCIFDCNGRKNVFSIRILKQSTDALKRKIRILNESKKKMLEKTEKIYIRQRRQHYNFRIRFWDGL